MLFIFTTALMISTVMPAAAEDKKPQHKMLFYTYVGPVAGTGYSHIRYKDWNSTLNRFEDVHTSGLQATGGAMFNIFVNDIIGDFRVEYIGNFNGTHQVHHLFWTILGKYKWSLTETISIATGAGIYFETPPANINYNGTAGFQVPVGVIINTTFDTRLVIDLMGRFGFYGYDDAVGKVDISENSYKVSYGITIGFLFKVGRL